MLVIIGAVILVLTYFVKDMLKEKAKDVSASVESGEALYRTESGQSHSRPNWAFDNIPTLKTLGIARL
jgi:hypothetical protein